MTTKIFDTTKNIEYLSKIDEKYVVSQLELFSEVKIFCLSLDLTREYESKYLHRVLKCIPYLNSPFDAFFSCIYLFRAVKNHLKSLILYSFFFKIFLFGIPKVILEPSQMEICL